MKRYVRAAIIAFIMGAFVAALLQISGVPFGWAAAASVAIGWLCGDFFHRLTRHL